MNGRLPYEHENHTRVAELLKQDAEDLKRGHTLSDGDWDLRDPIDQLAKAAHDERLALAALLTRQAATCSNS